jgi:hypothetical protein
MLKVRSGFAAVVAQRLRNLNLEVFVPENKTQSRESSQPAEYVYCRFELEDHESVISVPGVLDILGTPEPTSIVPTWSSTQIASHLRP